MNGGQSLSKTERRRRTSPIDGVARPGDCQHRAFAQTVRHKLQRNRPRIAPAQAGNDVSGKIGIIQKPQPGKPLIQPRPPKHQPRHLTAHNIIAAQSRLLTIARFPEAGPRLCCMARHIFRKIFRQQRQSLARQQTRGILQLCRSDPGKMRALQRDRGGDLPQERVPCGITRPLFQRLKAQRGGIRHVAHADRLVLPGSHWINCPPLIR